MNSTRIFLIVSLLAVVSFFIVYEIRRSTISRFAVVDDFFGDWEGFLPLRTNEDSYSTTKMDTLSKIKIDKNSIVFENLPMRGKDQTVFVRTGSASLEFFNVYSMEAPCIVLDCSHYGGGIFPIYIYKNKLTLYYPISPGSGIEMDFHKR